MNYGNFHYASPNVQNLPRARELDLVPTLAGMLDPIETGFDVPVIHPLPLLYTQEEIAGMMDCAFVRSRLICVDEMTYMTREMWQALLCRVKAAKLIDGTASVQMTTGNGPIRS